MRRCLTPYGAEIGSGKIQNFLFAAQYQNLADFFGMKYRCVNVIFLGLFKNMYYISLFDSNTISVSISMHLKVVAMET